MRKKKRDDKKNEGMMGVLRDPFIAKGYNYEIRVLHVIYLYGPRAEGKYTYFGGGEGASLSRNEGGKRLFVVLAAVSTSLTLPV